MRFFAIFIRQWQRLVLLMQSLLNMDCQFINGVIQTVSIRNYVNSNFAAGRTLKIKGEGAICSTLVRNT